MNSSLLPDWSVTQTQLDRDVVVTNHALLEAGCFAEEALCQLLDAHPREDLGVSSMGTDPTRPEEWRSGDAGDLSGEQLLTAVLRGRLWLNLRRVVHHHRQIADLVTRLYAEMERRTPGLRTFHHSANLLISSPAAIVYYHMDCPVNMLWHLAGQKRVWAYPPTEKYLPRQVVEDVIAGVSSEEIAYEPAWDQEAVVVDLKPQQMITWPQHSPHRVVNTEGLNVSLSTEHYTKSALRKNNVHLANRHFRGWHPALGQRVQTSGLVPAIKEAALRICRRVPGLRPQPPRGYEYEKSFVVDLEAPHCVRLIESDQECKNRQLVTA